MQMKGGNTAQKNSPLSLNQEDTSSLNSSPFNCKYKLALARNKTESKSLFGFLAMALPENRHRFNQMTQSAEIRVVGDLSLRKKSRSEVKDQPCNPFLQAREQFLEQSQLKFSKEKSGSIDFSESQAAGDVMTFRAMRENMQLKKQSWERQEKLFTDFE